MRKITVSMVLVAAVFGCWLYSKALEKDTVKEEQGQVSSESEPKIEELVNQLEMAETKIKEATEALVKIGNPTKPLLQRVLMSNRTPELKKRLEMILGIIANTGGQTEKKDKSTIEFLLEVPEEIRWKYEGEGEKIPPGYKRLMGQEDWEGKYIVGDKSIFSVKDIRDCWVCWWPNDNLYGISFVFTSEDVTKILVDNKDDDRRLCIAIDNAVYAVAVIKLDKPVDCVQITGAVSLKEAEFIVRTINLQRTSKIDKPK